jgi:hypothetical protein
MIRLVVVAIGMMLFALLLVRVIREVRTLDLDWTGIAFAVGFVTLAFYLRFTTGIV